MAALDERGTERLWANVVALVESEKEIVYVTGVFDLVNNAVLNLSHTYEAMLQAYQSGNTLKLKLHIPAGGAIGLAFDYYVIGDLSYMEVVNSNTAVFMFNVLFRANFGYGDLFYYCTLTIDSENNNTVSISIVSNTPAQ